MSLRVFVIKSVPTKNYVLLYIYCILYNTAVVLFPRHFERQSLPAVCHILTPRKARFEGLIIIRKSQVRIQFRSSLQKVYARFSCKADQAASHRKLEF